MSGGAFRKPSLRPYVASDLPARTEIRFAVIEKLTADGYDEAQKVLAPKAT
jgi:hypothetical protein